MQRKSLWIQASAKWINVKYNSVKTFRKTLATTFGKANLLFQML